LAGSDHGLPGDVDAGVVEVGAVEVEESGVASTQ
jgi:hypothetical protein